MTDMTTINRTGGQSGVATDENENPPGESVAGCPRHNSDVRTQPYRAERHEGFGAQAVDSAPSAGWREVYFSMDVDQRPHGGDHARSR